MGENSAISWTKHTFNPWIGCSKVHEGCTHCYAEELMATRYKRVVWGVNGTRTKTKTWRDPIRWNREAVEAGERHRVFCASLADVFEDRPELEPWRRELFDLIDATPQLDWQLLTKRPENILRMWPSYYRDNVWLGTSVSNQKTFDEFSYLLRQNRTIAKVLFLSAEPLLGPIQLDEDIDIIDWLIVGGESGKGARPCEVEWIQSLVRQCDDYGVRCFVKQLGSVAIERASTIEEARAHRSFEFEWPDETSFGNRTGKLEYNGRQVLLRDSKGGDWNEWPEDLRIREFPQKASGA